MTETRSIGLHDYEAVEYKNTEGRISYVLLYKWVSVGTTDHPDQGACRRQVGGKFRTVGEAFFYAALMEKEAELSYKLRRIERELGECQRQLAGWQWHRSCQAAG
jgi:hypothetical protein